MSMPLFIRSLVRSEPVRVVQLAAGLMLMAAGPVVGVIPAPLPIGLVLFGVGLALVLRNSLWARRRYVRWKRRFPRAARFTDFGLRRRGSGSIRTLLRGK